MRSFSSVQKFHTHTQTQTYTSQTSNCRPSGSMMVCTGTFGHMCIKATHTMPFAAFHGVGHVLCVATRHTHLHTYLHTCTHDANTRTCVHPHTLPNSNTISCLPNLSHFNFAFLMCLVGRN